MSQSESAADLVHATAVALGGKAALIRGPSGSGKSDLALRAIATPQLAHLTHRVELLSDDQVRLVSTPGGIEVTPPPTIAGKIEVRGLGIVQLPYCPSALLALVVDLVPAAEVPRYPLEERRETFFGLSVPVVRLAAFEPSAPLKLVLALDAAPAILTPP
ncbi:MAG: HPr kinase/phosphatase C-terminal domain-containing protein [Hyphomicrobium zavarzinii]|jgi:serine kinase of HPr protein (carbohydrate metabolism regulator)|uniref:HPr kinase/phosphorylase n=1 Tax=Hyphomicrobium zavarzinii TaxID=48292 RepID=UPI001A41579B|nr:HPr kinase/phosphatase C-terminal domain-containing protein [Hyphomicrobium zavarzinii]MBL8847689.1 HPr kinase/phosphatase C-terminal domain-containing protein [Hyphomicrobium zavarzinii]